MEEVARGTSIQELRARLTKKNDTNDRKEPSHLDSKRIPDDLVETQAYIRWENAGKPNYSPDQQLVNSKSPCPFGNFHSGTFLGAYILIVCSFSQYIQ